MSTHQAPSPPPASTPEISSVGVLLARLLWLLIGPIALVMLLYAIVSRGGGWLTPWDVAYLLLVPVVMCARWAEQRSGAATTATGEPALPEHLRRYVRVLAPLALLLWVEANVVANHVLA